MADGGQKTKKLDQILLNGNNVAMVGWITDVPGFAVFSAHSHLPYLHNLAYSRRRRACRSGRCPSSRRVKLDAELRITTRLTLEQVELMSHLHHGTPTCQALRNSKSLLLSKKYGGLARLHSAVNTSKIPLLRCACHARLRGVV